MRGWFIFITVVIVCMLIWVTQIMKHKENNYREECIQAGGDRVTVRILPGGQILSCWDEKSGRRIFLESE